MPAKTAKKAASKVRKVTRLVAKEQQPDVDAIVVATVVEGDGAEQFIDALHQVTRYYNADLVVGWTDGYEGVEPEDEEEEQEEQEEEEEQEEGEGEYTQDDLDEMDSDDLKAILEE